MNFLSYSAAASIASAAFSAGLTFALIRLSARLNLIAKPRSDRWHRNPTPNTGGIAIAASALAIYALLGGGGRSAVVAELAAAVALLGILDDRIQLRPSIKLAGQAIAAIAAIASGVVFRPTSWEPLNLAFTFLWIVGITNAFNLIDNMDGLCAGVTVIICGFRFIVAVEIGDTASAFFVAVLAGSYLGFLFFNYKPAKIFMGDGGSMFAGFTLAVLSIQSHLPHTRAFLSGLFYPALTFLYPIFDTVFVSLLRRLAGRPVSVGGRDHSSHRLASLGLHERTVVWLLWLLTALGCAAGLLTSWMPVGVIGIAALLLLGVSLLGVFLGTLPHYAMPEAAPVRQHWIRQRIPTFRSGLTLIADILLAGIALLCAFLLRWENSFPGTPKQDFLYSLPVMMICYGLSCIVFRSFHCGWRWFGVSDLITLGKCVLAGSMAAVCVLWMAELRGYSRGVIVLYTFLLLSFAVGLRVWLRVLWQTLTVSSGARRVAVLGANRAGELAVVILQKMERTPVLPVVVLDTDPASDWMRIHGVPVRYAGLDPLQLLTAMRAEVLILPPNAHTTAAEDDLIARCEAGGFAVERLELTVTPLGEPRHAPVLLA